MQDAAVQDKANNGNANTEVIRKHFAGGFMRGTLRVEADCSRYCTAASSRIVQYSSRHIAGNCEVSCRC